MLTPHMLNAGVSYSFWRASVNASYRWSGDSPWNAAGTQYRRHPSVVDAGGAFSLSDRISFFFTVKNVFSTPYLNMEKVGANPAGVRVYDKAG